MHRRGTHLPVVGELLILLHYQSRLVQEARPPTQMVPRTLENRLKVSVPQLLEGRFKICGQWSWRRFDGLGSIGH